MPLLHADTLPVLLACIMCMYVVSVSPSHAASNEVVELIGGRHPWIGYVRLTHGSKHGLLCDNALPINSAYVLCKQLGFRRAMDYSDLNVNSSTFLPAGPVYLESRVKDLRCKGWETTWKDCNYQLVNSGDTCASIAKRNALVICQNVARLQDGSSPAVGTVNIFHNGIWGDVCHASTSWNPLCRDLGFQGAFDTGSVTSRLSSTTRVTSVACQRSESSFADCQLTFASRQTCPASKYQSVSCGLIRLQGSSLPNRGRVEVFDGREWLGLCGSGAWHLRATADIVCRELGFSTAERFGHGRYVASNSGSPVPEVRWCPYDAQSLFDCTIARPRQGNCSQHTAYVECHPNCLFDPRSFPHIGVGLPLRSLKKGRFISLRCRSDFYPTQSLIYCRTEGTRGVLSPGRCNEIYCLPNTTAPANGSFRHSGHHRTLYCDSGYERHGPRYQLCVRQDRRSSIWRGQAGTCKDRNECSTGSHGCDDTTALCRNMAGSYECPCRQGFENNGSVCQDIDECANETLHNCTMTEPMMTTCHNTNGSYVCMLLQGTSDGDGLSTNPRDHSHKENRIIVAVLASLLVASIVFNSIVVFYRRKQSNTVPAMEMTSQSHNAADNMRYNMEVVNGGGCMTED
eukprot:scpid58496/ scgid22793/ Scavenger receptor cysteine-rich domain superfamily protein